MVVVMVMRESIWDKIPDILQTPERGGEQLVRSAVVESVREVRRGRWVVLSSLLVVFFWNNLDFVSLSLINEGDTSLTLYE